ncbi:MAG TPA: oxidoreductase [Verrucomicrobiales bacterium]|nr:oxidoreductase [Verrucomicrobiales bacterium]
MIQVGFIGLGYMAATHLQAFRQVQGGRVAALCNPSGRHLDGDFTSALGNLPGQEPLRWDMTGVKAYRDVAAFLADPSIQVVDICAPTHAHHEIALAALRAGKHVLCEKPLARTSAQAREMAAEAARVGRLLMPAMCLRWFPTWAWLKEAIASGRYGRVMGAQFRRVAQPPAWGQSNFLNGERSGGALLDLHIHDVDFVQYCFGRPKSVFSTGFTKVSGAIDHVLTQYEVEGGAAVSAEGSWAMTGGFGFNMSYNVIFERATADYDLSRGESALKLFVEGAPAEVLKPTGIDGYAGEMQHLLDCVREGLPLRGVTPAEGVSALEICEAEEKSIRTRQIVSLRTE